MVHPTCPSPLVQRLLEALSLALCLETQNPPNPITQAALEHSVRDLVAQLRALKIEFQAG